MYSVYRMVCSVYIVYRINYTVSCILHSIYYAVGRFKKYFFSQIITSIHSFVAPVAKKSPQKILSENLSGKPLRMDTPFFGSRIQVKF